MTKKVFLVFILQIILLHVYSQSNLLPNPRLNPSLCGNIKQPSNICDPHQILSIDYKFKINSLLQQIQQEIESDCPEDGNKGYEIAIALSNTTNISNVADKKEFIASLATQIFNNWQIGSKQCNNGILIFLSKNGRIIYIITGRGVKNILTDQQIDKITNDMIPYFKNNQFNEGIIQTVIQVSEVLKAGDQNLIGTFIIIFFLIFLAGIILSAINEKYNKNKYKSCKKKLQLISQDKNNKSFESTQCPICLEVCKKNRENLNGQLVELNNCGHKFCPPCYQSQIKEKNSCPICGKNTNDVSDQSLINQNKNFEQEYEFRLSNLQHMYKSYISREMVNEWLRIDESINLEEDYRFVRHQPGTQTNREYSSINDSQGDFGGGNADDGGGGGAEW